MRPSSIAILSHHHRHHPQQQQQQQRWEELVASVSHSATGWHSDAAKLGRRLAARVAVTSARTSNAVGVDATGPRYKCARQISPNFIRSLQFIIYRTYKRGRAMDGTSSLPLAPQQHSQHHQHQAQQHQQQQIQHAKRLHLHQHLASPSSSTDSATVTSGKSCNKSNQSSNFRSYVH